jgi:uncharacterized protein YoxC
MIPPLLLAQAGATPGWVGPTSAISLVLIALSFVAIAAGLVLIAKNALDLLQGLKKEVGELREELAPAIRGVKQLAEQGSTLAGKVEQEVGDVVRTSQRIRHDVERGVHRVKQRLSDLDALAEVMQEEIEDTALDVASRLRSLRRGFGVMGRLRRLVGGRRSRRAVARR